MYTPLIHFIKSQYPDKEEIHLHEPFLGTTEKNYLLEAIDTNFVSTAGPFVNKFEKNFSSYVKSKHTIATVNGTSALHLALNAADVKHNDLVITQSLTFVATPNAISYCGATPIFLDINKDTLSLCPQALKTFLHKNCKVTNNLCKHKDTNKTIKSCIPMHTFGHPARIEEIQKLCQEWNITLIEDSAESLGSFYNNKHTGTFGSMGVFSFNGNKIITSGGGGCVVTDNPLLAQKLKHLSTTAKTYKDHEFSHDQIGFNYRLPNINAAILVAQLEKLPQFLNNKKELSRNYSNILKELNLTYIHQPKNSTSNYWLNSVIMNSIQSRNDLLNITNELKIFTRPCWTPMTELPMYKNCINDGCHITEEVAKRIVNLPSGVTKS